LGEAVLTSTKRRSREIAVGASGGINWLPFLVLWLLFGLLGWVIGSGKGKGGEGFALGFLLGPLGMLIAALMSPTPEVQARRNAEVSRASAETRWCPWRT
jgi:hypothetical protein